MQLGRAPCLLAFLPPAPALIYPAPLRLPLPCSRRLIQDLAAYWSFNDPETNGIYRETLVARDGSGRGNDLHLVTLPAARKQTIEKVGRLLQGRHGAGGTLWACFAEPVQPAISKHGFQSCLAGRHRCHCRLPPFPAPAGHQPAGGWRADPKKQLGHAAGLHWHARPVRRSLGAQWGSSQLWCRGLPLPLCRSPAPYTTRLPPRRPCRDITVEFWARTPAYTPRNATPETYSEFISFAAYVKEEGAAPSAAACAPCPGWPFATVQSSPAAAQAVLLSSDVGGAPPAAPMPRQRLLLLPLPALPPGRRPVRMRHTILLHPAPCPPLAKQAAPPPLCSWMTPC